MKLNGFMKLYGLIKIDIGGHNTLKAACNMLKRFAVCSDGLRYAWTDCDMLRRLAICSDGLQYIKTASNMFGRFAIC